MSNEGNLDSPVFFTKREIEIFNEDLLLDLSNEQLESRIGEEIQVAEVLVGEADNPPPGVPPEVYNDFRVFADKENPTALIISGEYEEHYFRIARPKDYSSIEDTLQEIIQERQIADELEQDWHEHRQWDEQNQNND